jgi:outer membrane murein-binding lipoprotein Lpp
MKTKKILLGAFMAMTFFISCDNNDKNTDASAITNDEITTDAEIDNVMNDVENIAEDQYAMQQNGTSKTDNGFKSILPDCVTITVVLTNNTYTRTIDFGTQGCAMPNGNILKGKIIVQFSKDFSTPLKSISYSFENFYHNNKGINGSKTIEKTIKSTALLAANHPVTTHSIDMTLTIGDKIHTRKGIRTREMVEGFETPLNWEDNVFLVTGEHQTTFPSGRTISSKITSPLKHIFTCKKPFPVQGTIKIVKNEKEAILDYGDGTCDNLATITIDGVTREIQLKK